MAPSLTTTMSTSSSQLLASSINSSASSPRHGSSQISKIYRQASTLFLTRRLPESLSTILPVITSPTAEQDLNGSGASKEPAPIAGASRTTRIKVWSLYLTILNAVVELDPDEGKSAFGSQDWRSLVSKVRDGAVWEEVVNNGYGGVEGAVDSDVVINLATLLLAHARTQELNQTRLEAYLASSTRPNLDLTNRLTSEKGHSSPRHPTSRSTGTDTPRDLNARVKILELYTLHVLLRNNEWDYAREFISISEVLDEERREAFLQALQSLQDEQNEVSNREQEERRQQDEQLQRDLETARRKTSENEEKERERQRVEREKPAMSERASSEVDYGIESSHPNGSVNGSTKARSVKGRSDSNPKPARSRVSHASRPSMGGKKVVAVPPSLVKRAGSIIMNLRTLLENMARSFSGNPMFLLRTLAFIVAFLLLFSRRDVKERVRLVWEKLKKTAGMGVKVSYI